VEVVGLLAFRTMELGYLLCICVLGQNISFETSKGEWPFCDFSDHFLSRSELIRRKYCDMLPFLLLVVSLNSTTSTIDGVGPQCSERSLHASWLGLDVRPMIQFFQPSCECFRIGWSFGYRRGLPGRRRRGGFSVIVGSKLCFCLCFLTVYLCNFQTLWWSVVCSL
jgi:hypothetical protein